MKEKTCCFTGHRSLDDFDKTEIQNKLRNEIVNLINVGVTDFMAGGAYGFDTIAETEVLNLKNIYPNIRLVLALPCKQQDKYWYPNEKKSYAQILSLADEINYLSERYYSGCMQKRNKYMIDNSSYCICFLKSLVGGTASTINYAKSQNMQKIVNIYPMPI